MFPFEGTGLATVQAGSGCILFAEDLTVELVRTAIENRALGVITQNGSSACHGANLIRCARNEGVDVGWIRSVAVHKHGEITIRSDGTILGSSDQLSSAFESDRCLYKFAESASDRWSHVCLWPSRVYSLRELHLQLPGLASCAEKLCGNSIVTTSDRQGRIWYSYPALDIDGIATRAFDVKFVLNYSLEMMECYERLRRSVALWRNTLPDEDELQDAANQFFSFLLLFHRRYESIMLTYSRRISDASFLGVFELACTNRVSRWLWRLPEFVSSSKSLYERSWIGLVPDFSVESAVLEVNDSILRSLSKSDFVALTCDDRAILSRIAVLKEFKMILAKNLFSAAGCVPAPVEAVDKDSFCD